MILHSDKMKIKDYHTFIRSEISDEGMRALEWRRSLNKITIETGNFSIRINHEINHYDRFVGLVKDEKFDGEKIIESINASVSQKLTVICEVPIDAIDHSIYDTVIDNVSNETFIFRKLCGKITLNISEGTPKSEGWGLFAAGAFFGSCSTYDGNIDIYLTVDNKSINNLVDAIRNKSLKGVGFGLVIDSFSNESEDVWDHYKTGRNLVIHGGEAQSALVFFNIFEKYDSVQNDPVENIAPNKADFLPEKILIHEASMPIRTEASQLKHVKYTLWLIAFLLLLIVIK